MRIASAIPCTLLAASIGFGADPSLKLLEEQIQKSMDRAMPSVVSIVVSHRDYESTKKFGKPKVGLLTPFNPDLDRDKNEVERIGPRIGRGWPPGNREAAPPSKFDLSHADNIADNLFGSGIVIDGGRGLILTPYHLIEGATKIYVHGPGGKGTYANIHAADAKSDLAILQLIEKLPGLKSVKLADVRIGASPDDMKPTVRKGTLLFALGHSTTASVADGSPSTSWGMVSNVRQRSVVAPGTPSVAMNDKPLHAQGGLIQTDARLALGASGTGLFNLDGELMAIGSSVAAVYGSEANGGYAVPLDQYYARILDVLKEGKEVEYGFLGIGPEEIPEGILVTLLTPGGPAMTAGLRVGDVLTSIDQHRLKQRDDLLLYVAAALAGSEVTIEFKRDQQLRTTKAKLAKNSNPLPSIASVPAPTPFGIRFDHTSVKFAGPQFGPGAPQAQTIPPEGVLLRDIEPNSPADKAMKASALELPRGSWVVTHVDGKPVATPQELYALVKGKTVVKFHLADTDDPLNKHILTVP